MIVIGLLVLLLAVIHAWFTGSIEAPEHERLEELCLLRGGAPVTGLTLERLGTYKYDKLNLVFRREKEPFECYTNKHRTERDSRVLEYVELVQGARMGRFCIEHWPEATEHFEELRDNRPERISADDVQEATLHVKIMYERIRGAGTWLGADESEE